MKRVTIVASFLLAWIVWAQGPTDLSGSWEGQSLCTVPNSPCHNEHVVYRISRNKDAPGRYTIAADKIVSGKQEWMGDLQCTYAQAKGYLRCEKPGMWEFHVASHSMTGTLKLEDGTLYRKIEVKRR